MEVVTETPGGRERSGDSPEPAGPGVPVVEKDTRATEGAPGYELPPVAAPADLARVRMRAVWPLLCFGLTLLVYAALVPRFLLYSSPPTGDQPFYLMDTISLAKDGDLNVKNNYDNGDYDLFYKLNPRPPGYVGMSAPYPPGRMLAPSSGRPEDEQYDAHLPGLPALLVPAWIIGGWFSLWWPATVVAMCIIGALLAVNVFLFAHEISGRLWIAWAVWLPVAFSSPIMTYSYLIFTELPMGLLLIYAFRRLALGWGANGPLRLLLVGACIGFLPWVASRAIFMAAALGLYAVVQWGRHYRQTMDDGRRTMDDSVQPDGSSTGTSSSIVHRPSSILRGARSAVWFLIPVVIFAGLMLVYNLYVFGAPLPSATTAERGKEVIFNWPWKGVEQAQAFVTAAFGLFYDIQWGLLTYAPIYLLAVVGIIAMFRLGRKSDRRLLGWIALLTLPYMAVVAAFPAWHGLWCPPARYLTTFVPLLAGPLAMSLFACRSWLYKLVYAALALVGPVAMAIMMNNPILMWPFGDGRLFYGGVFLWLAQEPQAPVHPDLRHVIPSFLTPDAVMHPTSTGVEFLASFLIVLLGYLLISRRLTAGTPRTGRQVAVHGIAWVVAASVLGAVWVDLNYDFLKPKTVLAQQRRWAIPYTLVEPHGIAYLDGKIYIASSGRRPPDGRPGAGEFGVFDLKTSTYEPLEAVSAGRVLTYTFPGDVRVGEDGLLYVLNNGDGDQGMYVMKPDGQVVRQVALKDKSMVALGLGFAPGDKLYVTDMGRIQRYPPQGGDPEVSWPGPPGRGFNNVGGIAIDKQGRVYGAEPGTQLVLVFSEHGDLLKEYKLLCQPRQLAINGDWIDLTCNSGLASINTKGDYVQLARVQENDPGLSSPTGLTWAPDGTLYVLDGDTLVGYKVQR